MLLMSVSTCYSYFFFTDTAPTELYTLSLHDALPIWPERAYSRCVTFELERTLVHLACGETPNGPMCDGDAVLRARNCGDRSEEHTSELQSRRDLVCRLLLEKKKKKEI